MHVAAGCNCAGIVGFLAAMSDLTACDAVFCRTALHWAAAMGNLEFVRALVSSTSRAELGDLSRLKVCQF